MDQSVRGSAAIRESYRDSDVAREYVSSRFATPLGALLHARQVESLKRLIRRESINRAAEIAPGPARLTRELAADLAWLVLIDSSRQMLNEARLHLSGANTAIVQADAFHLPVRERFQLVFTFRLIRHFPPEDRRRLYLEIAGILEPGGWLMFDAVNEAVYAPYLERAQPGEFRHYDALLSPEVIRRELEACGFEDVELKGVQRRFAVLRSCQIHLAPRAPRLARAAMECIDRLGGEPLEWIVTCRRR